MPMPYAYAMLNRPYSPCSMPKKPTVIKGSDEYRHGIAYYNDELTDDTINAFELLPLNIEHTDRQCCRVLLQMSKHAHQYFAYCEDDHIREEIACKLQSSLYSEKIPARHWEYAIEYIFSTLRKIANNEKKVTS